MTQTTVPPVPVRGTCVFCEADVECRDDYPGFATSAQRRPVYFDPDVLDEGNPGTECEEADLGEHLLVDPNRCESCGTRLPVPAGSGVLGECARCHEETIAEGRLQGADYEAWAAL